MLYDGRARGRLRAGVRALSVRGLDRAAPRRAARSADLDDAERADLARALKTVLLKYDGLWERPVPVRVASTRRRPTATPHPEAHLHVEFYPRLSHAATGSSTWPAASSAPGSSPMDTLPEDKARELQAVEVTLD